MIRDGKEVKDEVRCWCGGIGYFHHIAHTSRKDGKITVIYKCLSGHRIFEEINDPIKRIQKEKKSKRKQREVKTPETSTDN